MLVCDSTADITDIFVTNTAVVAALWFRVSAFRESEDVAVFFEKVLLLETKPCVLIVENCGPGVGWVRISVRKHHFAHDERSVFASSVSVNCYGLEHAVGITTFCLLG